MQLRKIAIVLLACLVVVPSASAGKLRRRCHSRCECKACVCQPYFLPCKCPIWELDYLGDDLVLYYCDRFQNTCGDDPTADYVVGNHVLPRACHGECVWDPTLKHGDKGTAKTDPHFEGLTGAVPHDYPGVDLPGNAGKYCDILTDGELPYPALNFIRLGASNIYARVIVYRVRTGIYKRPPTPDTRDLYVAYQTEPAPTSPVPLTFRKIHPLEPTCHASVAAYKPGGGQKDISILVLLKR